MKHTKSDLSSYLFDELGGIDDKYIYEAQNYKSTRLSKGVKALISISSVAAAFFLFLTVGAVILISGMNSGKVTKPENILQRENGAFTAEIAKEQLFSGNAFLAWQYEGEDGYYVCDIESASLLNTLKSSLSSESPYRQTGTEIKLWLCPGDGTAISPYLKNTAGNISYGTLNSYKAEVEPTEQTFRIIANIVN